MMTTPTSTKRCSTCARTSKSIRCAFTSVAFLRYSYRTVRSEWSERSRHQRVICEIPAPASGLRYPNEWFERSRHERTVTHSGFFKRTVFLDAAEKACPCCRQLSYECDHVAAKYFTSVHMLPPSINILRVCTCCRQVSYECAHVAAKYLTSVPMLPRSIMRVCTCCRQLSYECAHFAAK